MSEETKPVTPPVDDAMVVQDQTVDEEKIHEELVAGVTKMLSGEETPDEPSEKPGEAPEEPPAGREPPQGEPAKKGDGEGLSEELQTRAKEAGLSDELAQNLHESGRLEETLAAVDRRMIDFIQSREETEEPSKESKESPKDEPPPTDQEVPPLDPDVYDEDLVKRDAYQQKRIDALERELEEFRSQFEQIVEGQQDGFDEWFDGILTDLGVDVSDEDKCVSVFKAYGAMCDAFGTTANARNEAMVKRAYAAMYPQEVFKQNQRQTVDRLRDAEGKFLTSPTSKGGPPPKGATPEEAHEHLVSNVTAYLKEQGVQMSGV